jgi:cytidylate kinase
MSEPDAIAIDGPAASGKTTLALALARELDYLYFDTGVMYRAVTLAALRAGVTLSDEEAVTHLAEMAVIDVVPPTVIDGRPCSVFLNGEDITLSLRSEEIDRNVSVPSAMAGVRSALTKQQQRIGERGRVVMVGRDIGTVVLPNADLKIYLDATVEARALRRWQEYQEDGRSDSYEEILRAMQKRDDLDSKRAVAPLRPADDAVQLDTTGLDVSEVYRRIVEIVRERGAHDDYTKALMGDTNGP